jgi:hypothetical protein
MKIRNGFVSNSSSSSFIIAIPKIKEYWSTHDISRLLGHEELKSATEPSWQDIESYLVLQELEKRIHLESEWAVGSEDQRRFNVEEYEEGFAEDFADLCYDDVMEDPALNFKATKPAWDSPEFDAWNEKLEAEMLRRGQLKLEEFKTQYSNHWIIKMRFEDSSVVGSHMEHDNVFHALPHIRFYNH